MDSILLWREIYRIADEVCAHFNLSYGKIIPATDLDASDYGVTYACPRCETSYAGGYVDKRNCNEKEIYIRTHYFWRPKKSLSSKTILRTLAHELAHLRHWEHGPEFSKLEKEILLYIQEMGYTLT